MTPHTWRGWRAHAVAANLIQITSTGRTPLLHVGEKIEFDEQFARVEIAVLFHRKLSQRARRAFVALSLFRQKSGAATVAIDTIGDDAGLARREVQRAMRELQSAGLLKPVGETRYGINRLVIKPTPPLVIKPTPLVI